MMGGRSIMASLGLVTASCVTSSYYPQNAAEEIADAYVQRTAPDLRGIAITRTTHEEGLYWVVVYELPEGYIGGAPTIWIRRSDGQIVRATSFQ